MSHYKDFQNIKTIDDIVSVLTKYHPELESHKEDLETVIVNIIEIITQYDSRLVAPRIAHIKERKSAQSKKDGLRKLAKKVRSEGLDEIADQIDLKESEQEIPKSAQGNKEQKAMRLVAEQMKMLWVDVLGHDKFYYDDGNKDENWAAPLIDDMIQTILKGQKITGLKTALSKIRDSRRVK
ncbi:MAG: hypothetical protein H6868_03145 [Rhodospirillales bacterium]|nr:hypothetical protein [Rhodospirillales bacterium]